MGRQSLLSRVLPKSVYRWLQRNIGVPGPPKSKPENYSDTYVAVRVPRNVLQETLDHLKELVQSFHDTIPAIIRCEMHCILHVGDDCIVNLMVRFEDRAHAKSLTIDGMRFSDWLVKGEEDGKWLYSVYEYDVQLLAGYDRGGSGRTTLIAEEQIDANKQAATKKKEQEKKKKKKKKKKTKKARANKGQVDDVEAGPSFYEGIEMEEMSEVRRGKQRQVDDVEAGPSSYGIEEIEMDDFPEVPRGKQKKVDADEADSCAVEVGFSGGEEIEVEAMSEVRRGKQPER